MLSFIRSKVMALAVLALFAATSAVAADATQMRMGADRSASSAESADLSTLPNFTTALDTKVTAGAIIAEPLVIGDRVFVIGDNAGEASDLVCVSASNGAILWRNMLPSRVTATPATAFGVIVVGTTGGQTIAYDMQDGSELWTAPHAGFQTSAIAIEGTSVIIAPGFGNDVLLSLNLFTGAENWRTQLDRFVNGAPAIVEGKILVALPSGSVEAYDLATGANLWKSGFAATGVYFGVAPTIAHDSSNGKTYLYIAPGGEEVESGSSISGFAGYVTYKVDVASGSMQRVVPGKNSSAPSFAEGESPAHPADRDALDSLPAKLQRELAALSDLASQLKVIETWESTMGFDFSEAKAALLALEAERQAMKLLRGLPTAASGTGDALAPSAFDPNWPSSKSARPGAAAYLARGTNRFLALVLQEQASEVGTPDRTLLFSIDPTNAGALRWFYAAQGLVFGGQSYAPSPIFVPKADDANGAWLVAPLGRYLAVFDAAGSNNPNAQLAMPDAILASPVFANGLMVVTDRAGNLRILRSTNQSPTAPTISAPNRGIDIATLGDVTLAWSTASDDTTAAIDLRYQLQVLTLRDGIQSAATIDLGAGVTSYALSGLAADTDVTFAVRSIDANGNAGLWSDEASFSYLPDRRAPYPAGSFTLGALPLALELTYAASPDEAPNGDADVQYYKATVLDLDGAADYVIDLGLAHHHIIDGANPATPLIAGHRYSVRLIAYDARANASLSIIRQATVLAESEYDAIPPHVTQAVLLDLGTRGVIDAVEITFSESINFGTLNIAGFRLGASAARAYSKLSESKILIDFGSGVSGTAHAELTYDEQIGVVEDLKANRMRSIGAADLSEIDNARPILLAGSIIAHDTNGDGRPDRIVARFSEPVNPASLELADIIAVRDVAGTKLQATSVALSTDGLELTIMLDGKSGTTSGIEIELSDNGNGNFIADLNGNTLKPIESNLAPIINLATLPVATTVLPGVYRFDASTSSDPDGDDGALSFTWMIDSVTSTSAPSFVSNGQALLTGAKQARIVFTEPGYFGIRLEVRDQGGRITTKLVSLRVLNQAPVANAGDDRVVRVGTLASLIGTRSYDANANAQRAAITSYAWALESAPLGATPTLLTANEVMASFATDGLSSGDYVFRLTVTDRDGAKSSDSVTITLIDDDSVIRTLSLGPDRTANVGQSLDLNTATRGLNGAAIYNWTVTPANLANVIETNQGHATIQFLAAGRFTVAVSANDGGAILAATLDVDVSDKDFNDVPALLVDAPEATNAGNVFTISTARSTDRFGQGLVAAWQHLSGPMLYEVARDAQSLSLYAAQSGTARFAVWVNDGGLSSRKQIIELQVHGGSTHLPQARASGPREVNLGETLLLDLGASNDADGHNLTFVAQELSALGAAISIDGTNLTITPHSAGLHRIALWARDIADISAPQEIQIQVKDPNRFYLSTASASATSIDLNTSASFRINGNASAGVTHLLWVQTSGAFAEISDANAASTSVTLPLVAGEYTFALYGVQDGEWSELATLAIGATGIEAPPAPIQTVGGSGGCVLADAGTSAFIGSFFGVLVVMLLTLYRRRRLAAEDRSGGDK